VDTLFSSCCATLTIVGSVAMLTGVNTTSKPRRSRRVPAELVRLQNGIRNSINMSGGRDAKSGVEPKFLKQALNGRSLPLERLTLRAQRLPVGSTLEAEYKVWLDGELLYRLILVPWESGLGARWFVRRHPEGSRWRNRKPARPPNRSSRAGRIVRAPR
jgi:hypothetical protein